MDRVGDADTREVLEEGRPLRAGPSLVSPDLHGSGPPAGGSGSSSDGVDCRRRWDSPLGIMRLTAPRRRETGGRATNAAHVAASREDRTLAQRARAASRVAEIERRRRSREALVRPRTSEGERGPSAVSNMGIVSNDVDRRTAVAKPRDRRGRPSAFSRRSDADHRSREGAPDRGKRGLSRGRAENDLGNLRGPRRSDRGVRGTVRFDLPGEDNAPRGLEPSAEATEAS
jgi:hypothetical protein